MSGRRALPGPVRVVLNMPSPPQQQVQQPPARRMERLALSSHATTELVSTTIVSPSARSLVMIVPIAARKAVPSPPTVCRTQPCPPQQQVIGFMSMLKPTSTLPKDAKKAPFLARYFWPAEPRSAGTGVPGGWGPGWRRGAGRAAAVQAAAAVRTQGDHLGGEVGREANDRICVGVVAERGHHRRRAGTLPLAPSDAVDAVD